jgi:hypothetical protein
MFVLIAEQLGHTAIRSARRHKYRSKNHKLRSSSWRAEVEVQDGVMMDI